MTSAIEIGSSIVEYQYDYSFCSLVTNQKQYEEMINSAIEAGFDGNNSEFLYIDNSKKNIFEAFSGIAHFLNFSKGRYIILCHQDLLFTHDKKNKLDNLLSSLVEKDPAWLIAGNAGANGFKAKAGVITHFGGHTESSHNFPFKATSLDENFLILNKINNPSISSDLKGFHFYGTELCKIAEILGKSCYVIDFHLTHLGAAVTGKSFYDLRKDFIKKYAKNNSIQLIQTTCTRMVIAPGLFGSWLLNTKLFIFLFKEYTKYKIKLLRFFA